MYPSILLLLHISLTPPTTRAPLAVLTKHSQTIASPIKTQVTGKKDDQIKRSLEQLNSSVEEWNSDKCPTVKAHIDRMKKAERVKSEEKECCEPEAEGETGGAMMTTSTSLLTITITSILAIFQLSHL